ncbi:MAG: bifunctional demethylmenaquinone methyltransferase/2-methoxy-6-polyprenyl-1,4-benzoquinol methylase UbiE, partial [Saprospiraceae bacterium]|nr:bifunctional demethylmenaquinone methyltransferase/2-methoxy-6-polyprenyl-1,4-benzoquinol methylase UbiE [Saprospiraceae bacterium]
MGKTVKPYQADGSKKEQVSKMFDNIAPSYDLLNRLLSLGIDRSWRKKAIRLLDPAKAKTVLDVATGTADVAIEIARQLKPEKIIGVDIAQQMLEIGREKVSKRGLAEVIELQLGDSENLPFESNTFDAITVAFGVRNFEDLGKGLSEMQRVLKPGGKLVVLEFSRPRIFPFKQLFNLYFRYLLPLIGRLTSKDPKAYSYLYESVQAFPDRENFVTELGKAG